MNKQTIFYTFFLVGCMVFELLAQGTPDAYYSFDGCSLQDQSSRYSDVVLSGNPGCSCAPVKDGMGPVQAGDILDFDGNLGSILSSDFTMSFYIKILNPKGSSLIEILSNESSCLQDSTFTVQFDQISQSIVFNLVLTPSNKIILRAPIDPDKCWNHVVLTREKVTFSLYINAEKKDEFVYEKGLVIPVRTNNPFRMGSSVCNTPTFIGFIDELQFYSKSLDINQVQRLYRPFNQILTPDTILVQGDILTPQVVARCQTNVTWSPSIGVSDVNALQPELSPDETTVYTLQINETDCISTDTLSVQVIDPGDVQCQNLYLPTAFTPNGDNINDRFGISNFYIIESLDYFDIFDKWGGVIFHTNDKNSRWDGSYLGKALNPGIYSYKISYVCRGKTYLKTGAFNILR